MKTLTRPLAERVKKLSPRTYYTSFDTPEGAITGAVQALDDGKTKYTNRPGIIPLREWIAKHVTEKYGITLDADDVTVTCGIAEAEFVALKYFTTQREGAIITADHTDDEIYVSHLRPLARLLGRDVLDHKVDEHHIFELMRGVTPQPEHFVTPPDDIATVYIGEDGAKTDALLHHAQENDLPIVWSTGMNVSDIGLRDRPDLIPNTLIIGGFETWLEGWRVGWMAGHKEHAKLRSYKQSMTICTPSISQWAALGMVEAQS